MEFILGNPKIVVFGHPKSGTSIFAKLISKLGYDPGDLVDWNSYKKTTGYMEHSLSISMFHHIYSKYPERIFWLRQQYRHNDFINGAMKIIADYFQMRNVEVYKENHMRYMIGALMPFLPEHTRIVHIVRNFDDMFNSFTRAFSKVEVNYNKVLNDHKMDLEILYHMINLYGHDKFCEFSYDDLKNNPEETIEKLSNTFRRSSEFENKELLELLDKRKVNI